MVFNMCQQMKNTVESRGLGRVLRAFTTYDNPDSNTWSAVIRSLIFQLAYRDLGLSAIALLGYREGIISSADSWREILKQLLLALVVPCWVFIDGVDECNPQERHQIIEDMKKLVDICPKFLVLISSRRETDIERKLSHVPQVIAEENNGADIDTYIKLHLEQCLFRILETIRQDLHAKAKDKIRSISHKLAYKADGELAFLLMQ